MAGTHIIAARVSPEMKERVHALAEAQLLSESIWLRRLIAAALTRAPMASAAGAPLLPDHHPRPASVLADSGKALSARVCVRLRPDDRLLLHERASARGLAPATYLSVLTRAHLRNLTPIPAAELRALKHTIAELTAVGRNLNQLARAANQGRVTTRPEDLRAVIRVCEALRDHVKELVRHNVASWEAGHGSVKS